MLTRPAPHHCDERVVKPFYPTFLRPFRDGNASSAAVLTLREPVNFGRNVLDSRFG